MPNDAGDHDRKPLTGEEWLHRLATVVIDSNDAVTLLDLDGNILAWNRGAERIYGYTQDEALRMNIFSIVPESERARDRVMMDRLRRGETIESFTTRRVTKSGQVLDVWLTITVLKNDKGALYAISTTERDITEMKRREEELRNSYEELTVSNEELRVNNEELSATQEKLRRSVEELNAVLQITTSAFRTLELDRLLHYILKSLIEVMKADSAVILLHEGDFERVYAGIGIDQIVRRREAIPFGKGFAGSIAANMKPLYIGDVQHDPLIYSKMLKEAGIRSMLGAPMLYNNNIVGVIHVDWTSVHPFSETEQDILKASAERCAMSITNSRLYEQTVALKKQSELYLDIMGHDINNLNQVALTNLEFIENENKLTIKQTDALKDSINAVEASSSIIRNVRQIQRISEEKAVIVPVDVNDLITSCIREAPKTEGRKITINYKPHSGIFVYGTGLMKDVFCNIINNAIKHSESDVIIDISIEESTHADRRFYDVIIADNGPGIPDELKKKIFNRFQRGETKAHGKGLGLFIVRSLIERAEGNVAVEDRIPGDHARGAKFIVSLPACEGCE